MNELLHAQKATLEAILEMEVDCECPKQNARARIGMKRWSGCKSFRLTRTWNCKITPNGVIFFYSHCIIVLIQPLTRCAHAQRKRLRLR